MDNSVICTTGTRKSRTSTCATSYSTGFKTRDATHFVRDRSDSQVGTFGTASATWVVLTPKGLSLTNIHSVSPGPPAIDDERMDTTRPVCPISKCLTRQEVEVVVQEWLPKQDRFNLWLRVKPVNLFYSHEMGTWNLSVLSGRSALVEPEKTVRTPVSIRTPEKESPATRVRHHQIFVTRDILSALKRPFPGQDEGGNWIRHRIRCCGRARENEGSSTAWSLNEISEKRSISAGGSASWRSWTAPPVKGWVIWRGTFQARMCLISSLSGKPKLQ